MPTFPGPSSEPVDFNRGFWNALSEDGRFVRHTLIRLEDGVSAALRDYGGASAFHGPGSREPRGKSIAAMRHQCFRKSR